MYPRKGGEIIIWLSLQAGLNNSNYKAWCLLILNYRALRWGSVIQTFSTSSLLIETLDNSKLVIIQCWRLVPSTSNYQELTVHLKLFSCHKISCQLYKKKANFVLFKIRYYEFYSPSCFFFQKSWTNKIFSIRNNVISDAGSLFQ